MANFLGVFPQYVSPQPIQLVLKERVFSLSGDSFSIKTVAGERVLECKGEALSLSGRKHVMDVNGNQLFDIRKEHFTIHTTFYCENPKGEKFFEVKKKFNFGGTKAIGTFTAPNGQSIELLMKGDFFSTKADITDPSGNPVAKIDRQFFNAAQVFGGQQTYVVTVMPGVDFALIAAMCICLDEIKEAGQS